jgi:hypothetical protein
MNAKMQNMVKVAMNKSLLKEYNVNGKRVVYLNDGDEFQLQFFNPHPFRVAASISFNDSLNSSRKLIINPGERVWLERYLDENKKLCFKTYWVDKGNAVVDNAIATNGKISINFYKEQTYVPTYTTYEPRIYYNTTFDIDTPLTTRYATRSFCKANTTSENTADLGAHYCQSVSDPEALKASSIYSGANATATAATHYAYSTSTITTAPSFFDLVDKSLKNGKNSSINNPKPKKQKETGRIEKGKYSNQDLDEISLNMEPFAFEWETIYILPETEKPFTNKDLQKKYCPNCGRKLKEKFKFCPFCGEKL